MGRETVLFKSKEPKAAADVATTLRQLADKIDQGQLTLRQGDQEVTLSFSQQMTLEIAVEEEIKTTHRQQSLEVEIEWYVGESEGPDSTVIV